MRTEINEFIVADSEICGGKPTFRGTRVRISQVFEMLEAGESFKDILEAYPSLTGEHIRAALHYAAEKFAGERFVDLKI